MTILFAVTHPPSIRPFPDRIVAFPITNRDAEVPWMAFDADGQVAFQSAAEKSHALYCMRSVGLDDVADDIETASCLSERSVRRVIDYSRSDPARRWCEMLRERLPVVIDAGIVDVFLGVEGTINVSDREQKATIGVSPFHIAFRHRIDIVRNAVRVFEMILAGDVVNPYRALYDRTALDVAYRSIISRSWANLDWISRI
jgi:hypothetical protein